MVHVRAQVMMRDDSTGGWLPLGGGGMSNVSVRKTRKLHQVVDEPCNHEYIIFGKRATDQTVSLNCILSRILLPSCPLTKFWLEKLMNTRKKSVIWNHYSILMQFISFIFHPFRSEFCQWSRRQRNSFKIPVKIPIGFINNWFFLFLLFLLHSSAKGYWRWRK